MLPRLVKMRGLVQAVVSGATICNMCGAVTSTSFQFQLTQQYFGTSSAQCATFNLALPVSHSFLHPPNTHGHFSATNLYPHFSKYSRIALSTSAQEADDFQQRETAKFNKLAQYWWDVGGQFVALHSLNRLRVPLIRDELIRSKNITEVEDPSLPLKGFTILDVGCGGGILSEPLARLGANTTGLDSALETVAVAEHHAKQDSSLDGRLEYYNGTLADLLEAAHSPFNLVVASEVIEHVADKKGFIANVFQLLRPGGSFVLTTPNRTSASYWLGVVVSERLLGIVPTGTHEWDMFIAPKDLTYLLEKAGLQVVMQRGLFYFPFLNKWTWCQDDSFDYAIIARKPPSAQDSST